MRRIFALTLAALLVFAGCGSSASSSEAQTSAPAQNASSQAVQEPAADASFTTVEEGKFTVGMECAYAPFNW